MWPLLNVKDNFQQHKKTLFYFAVKKDFSISYENFKNVYVNFLHNALNNAIEREHTCIINSAFFFSSPIIEMLNVFQIIFSTA